MDEQHREVDDVHYTATGWRAAVRPIGSSPVALVLLSLLAIALAAGATLGWRRGGEFAHWYIYDTIWFIGLLALVGINALCGVLSRVPWRVVDAPFVAARIGLVVFLLGALQTYQRGVEGQLTIVEGESTGTLLLPHRLQVTAEWPDRAGDAPYEFLFSPGPVAWAADRSLDLGQVDGVSATVVRFLRHAAAREEWRDMGGPGGAPLVRLKVVGPQEKLIAEPHLADDGFGDEVLVGPIRIQLSRAINDAMLADFQAGEATLDADAAPQGELVVYHGESSSRFNVRDSVGRKLPLGDEGVSVEIVECLLNAKPDSLGRFKSQGEAPRNPLLELLIHIPGRDEPLRQIALAKNPLLTLDQVRGEPCPIKFRYLHPAVAPSSSVEFMHGRDGRLFGRCAVEGKYQSLGAVDVGSHLPIAGGFDVAVIERMSSAKREILFDAVEPDPKAAHSPGPAAEVEIEVGGRRHRSWLARTDSLLNFTQIETPDGPLRLSLTPARRTLDFTVALPTRGGDAREGVSAGSGGDVGRDVVGVSGSGSGGRVGGGSGSSVGGETLEIKHDSGVRRQPLALNKPFTYREFTLVVKSMSDAGHGKRMAVLHVVGDPGRPLQYVGGTLLCVGIALSFVWPMVVRRRVEAAARETAAVPHEHRRAA